GRERFAKGASKQSGTIRVLNRGRIGHEGIMGLAHEHCQKLVQGIDYPEIGENTVIRINVGLLIRAEAKATQLKNSCRVAGRNFVEFALSTAGINLQNCDRNSWTLHERALVGLDAEHHVVGLNFDRQRLGIPALYRIQEQTALLIDAENV